MEEEPVAIGNDGQVIVSDPIGHKTKGVVGVKAAKPPNRNANPGSGAAGILLSFEAERRLIALVRSQLILYDAGHPRFHDVPHREKQWQEIARRLGKDLTSCLEAWSELRFKYQRHVRRLRTFLHSAAPDNGTVQRKRPWMRHEEELLFLYPHVARLPLIGQNVQPPQIVETEKVVESKTLPDVELVEPPTVDIIDLDLEEDATYNYRCTREQRRLIEAVQAYPLLYNAMYKDFQNRRHRGLVWGAISNELHDKATKLMKSWLTLLTRYEWELTHRPSPVGTSELCQRMAFMQTHLQRLRGTVCKASKYLKNGWHEPIEHFRSVMKLISTMRNMPELVQLTDESLNHVVKPPRYDELWQKVSVEVMCSHERCEVTWLLLRCFHHELQAMRLAGYQLQDKWYFENALSSIFKQVVSCSAPRQDLKRKANGSIPLVGETPSKIQVPPRLPLAIVYPPTSKGSSTSSATSIVAINASTAATAAATKSPSSSVSPKQAISAFVIPKITSALSVSSANAIPLRLPPTLRITPKTTGTMEMGVSPIATSNQLAGSNAKTAEVRPQIPQRPGLQVTIHTKPQMAKPTQMTPPVPRSIIQPMNPVNPDQPERRSSGGPVITLEALLSGTHKSQNPLPINTPAPHCNLVPIIPSNITANSNQPTAAAAPPMVQIFQPGLKSGWDGRSNSSPASKAMGPPAATSSTAAAPIAPAKEPARARTSVTKSKLNAVPATTADNNKKYRPIVPAAPKAIRTTKSAAEPATELAAPAQLIGTEQKARAIQNTPLFPKSTTQAASATSATQGTLASQALVAPPAKLPAVATATTVSQSNKEAIASPDSQPEPLPVGDITVRLQENILQIWCGSQATLFNLNLVRTATLIREVMAVPQLHKKDPQLAAKSDEFWKIIAKKFHMPEEALRACWKYLADNMSVFPMIAPMSDLMRPFKASVNVWKKSHRLFSTFDEIARKYLWLNHKDTLPELMQHFAKYEHLYWEMRKPRPGQQTPAPPQLTDQEKQDVWREARIKYPNLNHQDIWSMFKFAFRTYMDDLERGVENPWPQNWWQALEQLRFLANVRYHPLEPYYYIVHNKISEEVKRCSMYEALMAADPSDPKVNPEHASLLTRHSKVPMPWDTEEAKRLLTGKLDGLRIGNIAPAAAAAAAAQPISVPDSVSVSTKTNESKPAPSANVKSHKATNSSRAQKRLSPTTSVTRNLPPIEAFELTNVLRRQPHTFERVGTIDKRTAWVRVSKEVDATVTDCRFGLQYALREMLNLEIADPKHQCTMGHKYYHHMSKIYKQVKSNGQLTVRTPQQLNQLDQSASEETHEVKPREFLPEINVTTCSPDLVVNNWAYAVGNLSAASQDTLLVKLKQLFSKYAKKVDSTQP